MGHVGGGSSGSTKVTVEPDGVNKLNDSISWSTPDMGQFVTRMLRAWWEKVGAAGSTLCMFREDHRNQLLPTLGVY